MALVWIALFLSSLLTIHNQIAIVEATEIGLNYGLLGNDLPPAPEVVQLYKSINVNKVRLFEPNPPALQALRGSNVSVAVGIRNEDLAPLAASQAAVEAWFATNIEPYITDTIITYITVGNEVIPGEIGPNVLPVMQFLKITLAARNLLGIKVTTVLPASVLGVSFPPSAGAFKPETGRGILEFLAAQGWPLMINVYPYFAYASDPVNVHLDYAQFTAPGVVVQDGPLGYTNLFDAIVDAFVAAMEKENGGNVGVVVSETGWPSAGNGEFTTPALAGTYNGNLIKHIEAKAGTPKRPGLVIDAFIFATFNENQKPAGVEQNFGLFYPNKTPVYPIF